MSKWKQSNYPDVDEAYDHDWSEPLDFGLEAPLDWDPGRVRVELNFEDLERTAAVFGVMQSQAGSKHTYQVVTEDPVRAVSFFDWLDSQTKQGGDSWPCPTLADYAEAFVGRRPAIELNWPLPNVWLGVRASYQQEVDDRIPPLMSCPVARRFLVLDPLTRTVHLDPKWIFSQSIVDSLEATVRGIVEGEDTGDEVRQKVDEWFDPEVDEQCIEWVHVAGDIGGEGSGWEEALALEREDRLDEAPDVKPCNINDIRTVLESCDAANVPVFVESVGSRPIDLYECAREYCELFGGEPDEEMGGRELVAVRVEDVSGADPSEWPEEIRVRQYPAQSEDDADE